MERAGEIIGPTRVNLVNLLQWWQRLILVMRSTVTRRDILRNYRWHYNIVSNALSLLPVIWLPFLFPVIISHCMRWPLDIYEIAALYDSEINSLHDQLLAPHQVVRRRRTSDPYFDKECHDAKRLTRRLERAYMLSLQSPGRHVAVHSTEGPDDVVTAAAAAAFKKAWYNRPLLLVGYTHCKSAEFWCRILIKQIHGHCGSQLTVF